MRPLSLASIPSGGGIVSPDALEPIAIVGLATHFPQHATSTERLWELLLQARSTWSTIPKERFNSDAFYHPDPEHGGTVSRLYTYMLNAGYIIERPAAKSSCSSMFKEDTISQKILPASTAPSSILQRTSS